MNFFGTPDEDEEIQDAPPAMAPMPFAAPGAQPPPAALPPEQKAQVEQYIKDKYKIGPEYSDDARKALVAQNEQEAGAPSWAAGLAALSASMQGKDGASAGAGIRNAQRAEREGKLSNFDRSRAQAMQNIDLAKNDDKMKRESDPDSQESKIAREVALSMGMSPEQAASLTAEQFKQFSPVLKTKYEIAQRALEKDEDRNFKKEQNAIARAGLSARQAEALAQRDSMRAEKDALRQEKQDEKDQKLKTPYGMANSEDDAKRLKEAHESKQKFDSKVEEMIALRKKHGGGTNSFTNSEDVARAKQLSKDALLEYKNMAKLGVLSKSDEDIINAIIPEDPLAYNGVGATVTGQDPILNNLSRFKADSDKDFATQVKTRTRDGLAGKSMPTSAQTAQTKVVNGVTYKKVPDGWEEVSESLVGGGP